MEHIWAPWRIKFILENSKKTSDEGACIFCELPKADREKNYVLYTHPLAYVVLNIYPYTIGHLLIIPTRHTHILSDLTPAEHEICGKLTGEGVKILGSTMQAQGFNVGMNLGRVAGAGIPHHLHTHIVPRWTGDSNFMPVLGETHVFPESLESVYARLAPAFQALNL